MSHVVSEGCRRRPVTNRNFRHRCGLFNCEVPNVVEATISTRARHSIIVDASSSLCRTLDLYFGYSIVVTLLFNEYIIMGIKMEI